MHDVSKLERGKPSNDQTLQKGAERLTGKKVYVVTHIFILLVTNIKISEP